MKRKMLGLLVMTICICAMAVGCQKEEKAEKTEKKQEKKAEKLVVEKEYQAIGNKTDDAYEILIKNGVGQDIGGISVKSSDKQEWPENMILSGKKFAKDETVKLYYTPQTDDSSVQAKTDKAVKPAYDVQLTLADGTICQLSNFAFEDIEDAVIKYEEKVAYLEYTSKKTKEKVSTKEQELGIKAQKEQAEAAKKAAEEAQAAEEALQPDSQNSAEQQYEPQYTEPDYSQTYEEQEPVYTEPEQPAEQGAEGCLGGAEQESEGCLQ